MTPGGIGRADPSADTGSTLALPARLSSLERWRSVNAGRDRRGTVDQGSLRVAARGATVSVREVAIHEAGHAVIGTLFGAPITELLIYNGVRGNTHYGAILAGKPDAERHRAGAMAALAGPLAEFDNESLAHFVCKIGERRRTWEWGDDLDIFVGSMSAARAPQVPAIVETRKMLRANWGAILSLADALEKTVGAPPVAYKVPTARGPEDVIGSILGQSAQAAVDAALAPFRRMP